jgi:hypothetical protein
VSDNTNLQDKWISDEVFYRCIIQNFPDLEALDVDRLRFNAAMSRENKNIGDFSDMNNTGEFALFSRFWTGHSHHTVAIALSH